MKRFVLSILTSLLLLICISTAKADDPLNTEQRAWLKMHGPLRVAMSTYYPPFVFLNKTGEPQGMAIDFWRLLSSKLQFWVKFRPDLFENQLKGLKIGKYDSVVGIFPLRERQKIFDFSKPFTVIKTSIYAKPQYAHVRNIEDLKGLNVCAVAGDSSEILALKAGLNPVLSATYREAVFRVAEGDADALILDELVTAFFVKQFNLGGKVIKIGDPVDEGQMTLPVQKGNTILLDILNIGIDLITKTEWAEIEKIWLPDVRLSK